MKKRINFGIREAEYLTVSIVVGAIITFLFGLVPGGMVLGTHVPGFTYQGIPFAWTAHVQGVGNLWNALSGLGYWTYFTGFVADLIFWTVIVCIILILMGWIWNHHER